jgi:hypothetical protein
MEKKINGLGMVHSFHGEYKTNTTREQLKAIKANAEEINKQLKLNAKEIWNATYKVQPK